MLSINLLINSDMEESNNTQLTISENSKSYLQEIGKWSRFLGILMYVAVGFMLLGGLCFIIAAFAGANISGSDVPGVNPLIITGLMGGLYLALAVLYIFPAGFLTKAGSRLKAGIALNNNEVLEEGLKNTKSYYKFMGILAIVALVFAAVAIITAIIVGIAAAMNIG